MALRAAFAVAKYLRRYAEPEARLAASIQERYAAALVVPVYREDPSCFEGFQAAIGNVSGRVLVIAVVNAPESASEAQRRENLHFIAAVSARLGSVRELADASITGSALWGRADRYDVLCVDRSSSGRSIPDRQGVGLARRIGLDLALALWAEGRITQPFAVCTDADTALDAQHFAPLVALGTRPEVSRISALIFPFEHTPSADPAVNTATWLYEIYLRYYVLGLRFAGSPYAYASLGSALALNFSHYAAVRGFPARAAGEDFHLLNKLNKTGACISLRAPSVKIRARRSDRVPFGTGPATERLLGAPSSLELYAPSIFQALRIWLAGLATFARTRDTLQLHRTVETAESNGAYGMHAVLEQLGAFRELPAAASGTTAAGALEHRLHTWFDALRTLRFIHGMRAVGHTSLPWGAALRAAPFTRQSLPSASDAWNALLYLRMLDGNSTPAASAQQKPLGNALQAMPEGDFSVASGQVA